MTKRPRKPDQDASEKGLSAAFEERLGALIAKLGGATKVAERFHLDRSAVSKWKGGVTRPPLIAVAEMCAEAGFSIDWVMGLSTQQDDDFAYLPLYEARAAAGTGLVPAGDDVAGTLAFRRDWLRHAGIPVSSAGLMTAVGDSMHPTVPDGSVMLVDMAAREPRDGCIYVLARDDAVVVKRLQRIAGGAFYLLSDNPLYEREEVARSDLEGINVVGRVVWVGHRL